MSSISTNEPVPYPTIQGVFDNPRADIATDTSVISPYPASNNAGTTCLKLLKAGSNVTITSTDDTVTLNAVPGGGSVVNTVQDQPTATGVFVIGPGTASDVRLRSIKAGNNIIASVNVTEDIVIDAQTYTTADAAGTTGQSLISGLSTAYDTYLKAIKAGAGVSVSTVGQDIVIAGAGAIFNPANEIYIDASYSGTEAGTASEPFITLDAAITHLATLPLGNYVFIFNQGSYSTAAPWAYPMGDGTTQKSLSMLGKVANGCTISSDINFIGIAGEQANFQINSMALVGAVCTLDLSAYTLAEFASISFVNGFINQLDYTGPPLGNASLVGYIRSGVGALNCIYNGPTLQNSFLIGPIVLQTADSRIFINSCSNVNCTLTSYLGAIANISGLVSTTNPNWLVSADANLNLFYLDAWTGAISTLIGNLTLAKVIINKELIAGMNVTLTQNAQGQTTIDAASAGPTAYTPLSLVYLDNSYPGVPETGTIFEPFKTISGAIGAVNSYPAGQYTLNISTDGTVYTQGSTINWPLSTRKLSAVGVSGVVSFSDPVQFVASAGNTNEIIIDNIKFTGTLTVDLSPLTGADIYHIVFRNCHIAVFSIITDNAANGVLRFEDCTLNPGSSSITGGGKVYYSGCIFENSIIDLNNATLELNNNISRLGSTINLQNAGIIYMSAHQSSAIATWIVSLDASANRLYMDERSASNTVPNPSSVGLGTTFQVLDLVASTLTAGSGISLNTNPSTGKTQISASFAYTPQINDLTDGYHNAGSIALGFKPTISANYDNSNIYLSNTQPSAITSTAANNTVIGNSSLSSITTGLFNCSHGLNSLNSVTTGSGNVGLGEGSGSGIDTGSNNVMIGRSANVSSNGSNRIAIGANSLATVDNGIFTHTNLANQTGTSQKVLTYASSNGQIGGLSDGTTGQCLTTNGSGVISWGSRGVVSVSDDGTGIGQSVLSSTSTSEDIKLKQLVAGSNITITSTPSTGNLTIAAAGGGATNLSGLSDAYHSGTNLCVGVYPSLPVNFVGGNIFLTTTDPTTSILPSAISNIGIGNNSLTFLQTGDDNVSIGHGACNALTSGIANIVIGSNSMNTATTALQNIVIGVGTGQALTSGTQNILLGNGCNVDNGNRTGAICLGYNITSGTDYSFRTWPNLNYTSAAGQKVLVHDSTNGGIGPLPDGLVSGMVLTTNAAGSLSWTQPVGATTITTLSDAYKGGSTITLGFKDNLSPMANSLWVTPYSKPASITTANSNIILTANSATCQNLTSGQGNVIISPTASHTSMTTNGFNTSIGAGAGGNNQGDEAIFLGYNAGSNVVNHQRGIFIGSYTASGVATSGSTGSIVIGSNSSLGATAFTEQIVLGYNITGCNITRSLTMAPNLAAQAGTANRVMTLSTATGQVGPISDGTAGQVLTTNGSGSLSWTTPSGGGGTVNALVLTYANDPTTETVPAATYVFIGDVQNLVPRYSNTGGHMSAGTNRVDINTTGDYKLEVSFTWISGGVSTDYIMLRWSSSSLGVLPGSWQRMQFASTGNAQSGWASNSFIATLSAGTNIKAQVGMLNGSTSLTISGAIITVTKIS